MIKFEEIENIKNHINNGVDVVEKHLNNFEETEKEIYCYMINNIEVLLRVAYRLAIRDTEIHTYKNILKEFKKENISLIKLETLEHLQGFDNFNELQEEQQNKILDFVYSYWIESDLQEHTLFDYIEVLASSNFYGYGDIFANIEKLSYKDFVNIIEEKEIL